MKKKCKKKHACVGGRRKPPLTKKRREAQLKALIESACDNMKLMIDVDHIHEVIEHALNGQYSDRQPMFVSDELDDEDADPYFPIIAQVMSKILDDVCDVIDQTLTKQLKKLAR